jgi:hypothetical protein
MTHFKSSRTEAWSPYLGKYLFMRLKFTPSLWSRVLREKLIVVELTKNISNLALRTPIVHFHVYNIPLLDLFRVTSIRSIPSHLINFRSILMLSFNVRLIFFNLFFPSGFPTRFCSHFSSPVRETWIICSLGPKLRAYFFSNTSNLRLLLVV